MEATAEYVVCAQFVNLTREYLLDAGFTPDLYEIVDFCGERGYIEVHFVAPQAVDYLLIDLKKTKYKWGMEIKKYKIAPHQYCAIVAPRET